MNILKTADGSKLTLALVGRLDTGTSPELESALDESLAGVQDLVFDLKELEYISSAGLRVLLKAQKAMAAKGSMVVTGANETILEIFDITGFADILTLE